MQRRMLERYEIPCFIDEKQTVLMNPFIEFLRACIDMLIENYSYESVFRFSSMRAFGFDRKKKWTS